MDTLSLCACSADEPGMQAVIETHLAQMRAQSPEESCHALPATGLRGAYMRAAEQEGAVVAIGALAPLWDGAGEIKSMHTLAAGRGHGAGRAILRGLLARAVAEGLTEVYLETGSAPEFAPARALYASEGFAFCPPFGNYALDPLSVFMTRRI